MAPDLTAMDTAPLIIAAGCAGLTAMFAMIQRGLRAERDLICEGRAQREAAQVLEVARPMADAEDVGRRGVLVHS